MKKQYRRWAILRPGNGLSPDLLMGNLEAGMTTLYKTRAKARRDVRMRNFNAMIRDRKDLREPPHEWKANYPVKVIVTVETI